MHCTLQDILRDQYIPHIRLLTRPLDFSRRSVTGISVQEMPLDNFIQESEIILSTAVGYQEDPSLFQCLFQHAASARASAIILTFKDEKYLLPPESLDYANRMDLPVFTIPWNVHFAAVQKAVLTIIHEKEMFQYKDLQSRLFNLFFENKRLQDAAILLARMMHCNVEISEINGKKLACQKFLYNNQETFEVLEKNICISGTAFGQLTLYIPPPNHKMPFHSLPADWERYVLFPLSLWFNRKRIEDNMTMQVKNNFVRNLARGAYESWAEMAQQGLYLSFDLQRPYACLLLAIRLPEKDDDQPSHEVTDFVHIVTNIERILLAEGRRYGQKTMVGSDNLKFIIYLENKTPSIQEIKKYIDNAEEKIQTLIPRLSLYWGISNITMEQPCPFRTCYQNAELALKYCLENKDSRHHFTYKDTKKALIISSLTQDETIRGQARETLQPLFDYDENSGIELFQTLTTYIKANYNVSQTARLLMIHRQTLLYRLEKIQSLTGMNLNDHNDLFVLESFARLYRNF